MICTKCGGYKIYEQGEIQYQIALGETENDYVGPMEYIASTEQATGFWCADCKEVVDATEESQDD